jgi:uncharacterized protein YjiS (DUF1127 family)
MAPVAMTEWLALPQPGVPRDTAPPSSAENPSAVRRRLIVGWLALRTWLARRHRRRQAELGNLSDHLLRDINVSSLEARESTRSLWPPAY